MPQSPNFKDPYEQQYRDNANNLANMYTQYGIPYPNEQEQISMATPMQNPETAIKQEFPQGMQPQQPMQTQKYQSEINMPAEPVQAPFKGTQYPEIMQYMQNKYPQEFMRDQAESRSTVNPYDSSNQKIMNSLVGGLAESANQVGNVRGQVSQSALPEFTEGLNKQIDQRDNAINQRADEANKRSIQDLALSKESYNYSRDTSNLNGMIENLRATNPWIPQGTTFEAFSKAYPSVGVMIVAQAKAKAAAENKDKMTPYQAGMLKLGAQRNATQADSLENQKAQKEIERGRLSDTQVKNLTDKQDALAQVDQAIASFETNKPRIGPLSSMTPDFLRTDEGIDALSSIRRMKDSYRRIITGAAAGPAELKQLEKSIPNENDTPDNFRAKAKTFREDMANFYNRYWANVGKQGKNVEEFKLEGTSSTPHNREIFDPNTYGRN